LVEKEDRQPDREVAQKHTYLLALGTEGPVRFGFISIMAHAINWQKNEIGGKIIALGTRPRDVPGSMLRLEMFS
jgi:hypothetical protein